MLKFYHIKYPKARKEHVCDLCNSKIRLGQNWKALAGIYGRDEYFELTYNGDKKELYLDVYKKSENVCLKG